jgi:hypothetical protein
MARVWHNDQTTTQRTLWDSQTLQEQHGGRKVSEFGGETEGSLCGHAPGVQEAYQYSIHWPTYRPDAKDTMATSAQQTRQEATA